MQQWLETWVVIKLKSQSCDHLRLCLFLTLGGDAKWDHTQRVLTTLLPHTVYQNKSGNSGAERSALTSQDTPGRLPQATLPDTVTRTTHLPPLSSTLAPVSHRINISTKPPFLKDHSVLHHFLETVPALARLTFLPRKNSPGAARTHWWAFRGFVWPPQRFALGLLLLTA